MQIVATVWERVSFVTWLWYYHQVRVYETWSRLLLITWPSLSRTSLIHLVSICLSITSRFMFSFMLNLACLQVNCRMSFSCCAWLDILTFSAETVSLYAGITSLSSIYVILTWNYLYSVHQLQYSFIKWLSCVWN